MSANCTTQLPVVHCEDLLAVLKCCTRQGRLIGWLNTSVTLCGGNARMLVSAGPDPGTKEGSHPCFDALEEKM